MAVKNYTTTIKVEKTIAEIESILVRFSAKGILKEYLGSSVSAIIFFIEVDNQKIPFKLPMNIEKTRRVIENAVKEGKLPQRYLNEPLRSEQGERVCWRIIKDWIHAQVSLYEVQLADSIEILLPYAYNVLEEKTMYEKFLDNKSKFLALEDNNE